MIKKIALYTAFSIFKKKGWMLAVFFMLFNIMSYFYINSLTDFFIPQIFVSANLTFFLALSILFSIMWSYSEIGAEIKDKKNYIILGKGVSRSVYLYGKYSGILFSLIINSIFVYAIIFAETLFFNDVFSGFFSSFIVHVSRIAMFTALFAGINTIFSLINSFGLSVLGFGLSQIVYVSGNEFKSIFIEIIKLLLPCEYYFAEVERAFLSSINIPFNYLLFVVIYSLFYIYIILNIFSFFFSRKEL
ncbi:MAG: hypothetical protein WC002_02245 [Candidatus Muiribacteriota bacterium]